MLTILAGEPGSGKSALALRLAAVYLKGDCWPDGITYTGDPGTVLWCESEAAQAVNLERARAWELPLERLLMPFADPLCDVQLDDQQHKGAIEKIARCDDVRLVIIDSLRGAHRRDENSSETITVVKWLAELARDAGKPVLLTHHLRKRGLLDRGDGVELERLRGSSAIAQTARLVWALDTPNQLEPNCRRLSVVKSNLACFPNPLGLIVDESGVHFGPAPELPRQATVLDRAVDLLLALLSDGPKPAEEIQREVEEAGLSWVSAKRAKSKLGIVSVKPAGVWHWSLPAKD
jgi:hypothetical protein